MQNEDILNYEVARDKDSASGYKSDEDPDYEVVEVENLETNEDETHETSSSSSSDSDADSDVENLVEMIEELQIPNEV